MGHAHDLVIRGGTVADGSGGSLYEADVAIAGDRIVAVGPVSGAGREEIDARGLLVTPGFVDIHTHYDGHVTWEDRIIPSNAHGVTTVVTGNCGVGFAPCRPQDRDRLIELMAGVEDIPEPVMAHGLPWTWESFPEYLDRVDERPHDTDVAVMLPHSALRVYVMGQRAADREDATADDIAAMAALTREAMRAGAIGFATSRQFQHRTVHGQPIPTVRAAEDELLAIVGAMAETRTGVFQFVSDFYEFADIEREWAMVRRLLEATRRPTSFTVNQKHHVPDGWRELMDRITEAADDGLPVKAQVLGRPTGVVLGLDLSVHPFLRCPTYRAIADLPFAERLAELRRDDVRSRILEQMADDRHPDLWKYRFEFGDPPNYEPAEENSIANRAAQARVSAAQYAYDLMVNGDGTTLLYHAFQNYASFSLDACAEMMANPAAVLGLGDGGAHVGIVCDASYPTTMLAYWTRDRVRGPRLAVPDVVRALTSSTAETVGLYDRGRLAPGYLASVNVIDYDRLRERAPEISRDLPGGGRRLVQRADGYVVTVVNGVVTRRDGSPVGPLPGRLVRGAQPSPAS